MERMERQALKEQLVALVRTALPVPKELQDLELQVLKEQPVALERMALPVYREQQVLKDRLELPA